MAHERKNRNAGAGRPTREGYLPLTTLALLFILAEPLGVAFYAASVLQSVIDRGAWAVLLLAARLAITAIGVGAGLALWNHRPGALSFARVAVALTAIGVLVTFLAPAFPRNRPPGTTGPLLAALLVYYGAWFAYLTWRLGRPRR